VTVPPIYASCSGHHDLGRGNVYILQNLQSDCQPGEKLIQCYLNNVTNFCQLTLHSVTWRSYCDHWLQWHHFTLYIQSYEHTPENTG